MRLHLLLLPVLLLLLGHIGFGQMTYSYSSYVQHSNDATHIYATAVVDGSATCNNTHIQSLNCSAIYHQGKVYLTIGNTGGWVYGGQVNPNSYISVTNSQTLTDPAVGTDYTLNADGEVFCSGVAGLVFLEGFLPINFRLAYTKSVVTSEIENPSGNATCYTSSWCTPTTTPPLCNPSYVFQQPLIAGMTAKCWNYYNTIWLWEQIGSAPGTCIPLIPGQNATGTQDTSLYSCTH